MSRRHSLRSAAFAVALAALVASGCYGPYYGGQPGYGGPPSRGAPSGPPGPTGRMLQPRLGIGASAGGIVPSDQWLTGGAYVGGQVSLWLSDMIAFQVDVGTTTFDDRSEFEDELTGIVTVLTGDLTVVPVTASVICSMPDPYWMNEMYRWRFGIGVGRATIDHSDPLYVLDDMTIFTVQVGGEWVLPGMGPGAGAGRVFAVFDWIIGEEVTDEVTGYYWDLSSMFAFRVGMEFQF